MAKMQYSRHELFILRNHIPVDSLIERLGIPCKRTEGGFRFCCPICREFDTGVNPKTNLARCFRCERNYNPIDIVMLVKQLDFIHSVKYLQAIYEQRNTPARPSPSDKKPAQSQPVCLGSVLKSMEPALKARFNAPPKNEKSNPTVEMLNTRLSQLEHQVNLLSEKIKRIEVNS